MSRKSNRVAYSNITNASMGANVTSSVSDIIYLDNIGVQVTWSAGSTPVGVLSIEVSADYAQDYLGNVTNAGNWVAIGSLTAAVSGNSGSVYFDINQISAPWIRVVYTRTSGSGTLNSKIVAKMV